MISSGCSPAIAARTTSSTSPASRTFRVSTSVTLPGLVTKAAALPAAIIAIPSKGLDAGHKGGNGRKATADQVAAATNRFRQKNPRTSSPARFELDRSVYDIIRSISNYI